MSGEFPYTSEDPKVGDPSSLSWEHFARPKLRRFPQAPFTIIEYLGHGADGIVVKVKADLYPEPIALKIVSFYTHYYFLLGTIMPSNVEIWF